MGLKIDPITDVHFSNSNSSLISDKKVGIFWNKKTHIECEQMYDTSMLIVYFPQKWWTLKKKKNDIAR